MMRWTKRQDGQTTIHETNGTGWKVHQIGRCVYLNTGEQFITYTTVKAAKIRIEQRISGQVA